MQVPRILYFLMFCVGIVTFSFGIMKNALAALLGLVMVLFAGYKYLYYNINNKKKK